MIQLRVKNESDLYSRLDPTMTRLNDEVYSFLKSFLLEMDRDGKDSETLQIISQGPIDAARVEKAILGAVGREQDGYNRQIVENNRRTIWSYIVGIALSIIGFGLSVYLDQVALAIISFFGTMILREAIIIGTKINPDIKRLKTRLDPLRHLKLEVVMEEQTGSMEIS